MHGKNLIYEFELTFFFTRNGKNFVLFISRFKGDEKLILIIMRTFLRLQRASVSILRRASLRRCILVSELLLDISSIEDLLYPACTNRPWSQNHEKRIHLHQERKSFAHSEGRYIVNIGIILIKINE